jgi:hypothetical protein
MQYKYTLEQEILQPQRKIGKEKGKRCWKLEIPLRIYMEAKDF